MEERLPIPETIKRQLRQEAGFGCVVCGHPLFDYHHIIEYSVEAHNRPEDMVIVCPNHHREFGKISEAEQRQYKSKPFNVQNGNTNGLLYVRQADLVIDCGKNYFVTDDFVIKVDEDNLISISTDVSNRLMLKLNLFDEKDNCLLLLENNEWISGNKDIWDIDFKLNYLKIQQKKGAISVEIDARVWPLKVRGNFWRKDFHIRLSDRSIYIKQTDNTIANMILIALSLHLNSKKRLLQIVSPYNENGGGVIDGSGNFDMEKALRILQESKNAAKRLP